VNEYKIDRWLIDTFLRSMEMDLTPKNYNQQAYEDYILGSAEVVGLMCLKVFVEGDIDNYERLKGGAMKLGSAFQKINFLRDFKDDKDGLGRLYFPELQNQHINENNKRLIEEDIKKDFEAGFEGIKQLPKDARFGVYVAYNYYYNLLRKIMATSATTILQERVSIPDRQKYILLVGSYLKHQLNLI
jgi:15-cis-phytoene synthase